MTEKTLVIYYKNVNNNQIQRLIVDLPDNSGEITNIERYYNKLLHTRYGRISDE